MSGMFHLVVFIFFVLLIIISSCFENQRNEKDQILANYVASKFFSGGYFISRSFVAAYNKYCEKGKGCIKRPRKLSLKHGIILWRFRCLLIRNALVMVVVIPVVFILAINIWNIIEYYADTELITIEKSHIFAVVLTIVEIIYTGVLYLRSLSVFHTWRRTVSDNDMSAIEDSYTFGDMFICRESFLIVSPAYLHIFNGEHFYSLKREGIWKLKCLAIRIKYYREKSRGGGSYYASNEYRFRIDFISTVKSTKDDHMGSGITTYGVELNQYQIKMLIDKYFGELKREMIYKENGNIIIMPRIGIKENRIIR